jgi:hypothetical protein
MKRTSRGNYWRRAASWAVAFIICSFLYVLSSGPVLATAFWLRETTGWDGFYGVMYLYYPLLVRRPGPLLDAYIEWWVRLFGTVGPG